MSDIGERRYILLVLKTFGDWALTHFNPLFTSSNYHGYKELYKSDSFT